MSSEEKIGKPLMRGQAWANRPAFNHRRHEDPRRVDRPSDVDVEHDLLSREQCHEQKERAVHPELS